MSRTITAMFDTRADADAGKQRLLDADIDADNVRVHDQSHVGDASRGYSTDQDPGMWASIKNAFLPDEDRHTYEEGVRRGGFLLTADVDEDEVDDAVRVLESSNSIDIDERAGQWRSQGWDYPGKGATGAGMAGGAMRSGDYDRDRSKTGDEQKIDVVEEQLVVGKREVDREVGTGDEAFRDRTIEMTETSEEAVVGKKARVVEEVVVRKTADERVEEIDETVRRTEVDVENLSGSDRTTGDQRMVGDDRDTRTGTGAGNTAAGMGKEALGNVKQGLGSLTGSESLKRSGEAQERAGEQQQGRRPD